MDASLFHGDLVKSNRIIYTASAFAKTNLIYLQEIGELEAQQPHTSKREDLSSFLFFTVISGSGALKYGEEEYMLSTGDCAFLDCKKSYYHHSSENLWKLKWVHFYGPNMNGIYEKYVERGGRPCFQGDNFNAYNKILTEVYNIASSDIYIKDMKIYEQLTSLLVFLMEESWNPNSNNYSSSRKQNLQNIKEYLDEHYSEKITLNQLSKIFYINKFYLSRIFKDQFGITINNYILQLRITHAKQLLRFTNLSIDNICRQCGINDANYFSRIFKNVEGISPGEFRKIW